MVLKASKSEKKCPLRYNLKRTINLIEEMLFYLFQGNEKARNKSTTLLICESSKSPQRIDI